MKLIELLTTITGLLPYALLIQGILKGEIKQSFATWILWLALDIIMIFGIVSQKGNPLLYSVFTLGTFLVTTLLVIKKQYTWGWFETEVTFLVGICIGIYFTSGAHTATIATMIALDIAGIPQLIATYKKPKETSTIAYLLFTVSSLLAVIEAEVWTDKDSIPQMNAMVYCLLVTLFSVRNKITQSKI
jgi:hypothetical protein